MCARVIQGDIYPHVSHCAPFPLHTHKHSLEELYDIQKGYLIKLLFFVFFWMEFLQNLTFLNDYVIPVESFKTFSFFRLSSCLRPDWSSHYGHTDVTPIWGRLTHTQGGDRGLVVSWLLCSDPDAGAHLSTPRPLGLVASWSLSLVAPDFRMTVVSDQKTVSHNAIVISPLCYVSRSVISDFFATLWAI